MNYKLFTNNFNRKPVIFWLVLLLFSIFYTANVQARQVCNVNAGPDQDLCFEMSSFNLQGIIPANVNPASVNWTQDLGLSTAPVTINNVNDPLSAVTPAPQANFTPGTYTFILEGRCTADNSLRTDVVVINIQPAVTQALVFNDNGLQVTANPHVVCRDVSLTGSLPAAGENGVWTFTGVQANQFSFNTTGNQVDGSWNILQWYPNRCEEVAYTYTISNGNGNGCFSSETVNVRHLLGDPNQVRIENVADGANFCSNQVNFRGTRAHCDATINWQINPLFTPQSLPAATFLSGTNSDQITATFNENGAYQIIYDVDSNGVCASGADTITVNICIPTQAPITVYDGQTICGGQQPAQINLSAPFPGGTWQVFGATAAQVTIAPNLPSAPGTSEAVATIIDQNVQQIIFRCTAPFASTCVFPDGSTCDDDHFYQYVSFVAPDFSQDVFTLDVFCAEANNFIRPSDHITSNVGNADGIVQAVTIPAGSPIPANSATNICTFLDFSVPGQYVFNVITPPNSPCPDQATWIVNVLDLIGATAGSSANNVCLDDVVLLVGNDPLDQNMNLVPGVNPTWVQTSGPAVTFVNGINNGTQVSVTNFPAAGTYTFQYIFANDHGCDNSASTTITVNDCADLIIDKEAFNMAGNETGYVYVNQPFQWIVTIENPASPDITINYQDLWPQNGNQACASIISYTGGDLLSDQITIPGNTTVQLVYDARACADGGSTGTYQNCFTATDVNTGQVYNVCDDIDLLWGCPADWGDRTADHTGQTPFYMPMRYHAAFMDIDTMRFSVYYDPTFMTPLTSNEIIFSQAVIAANNNVNPVPVITYNGNQIDVEFWTANGFHIAPANGGFTPVSLGFKMVPGTLECCEYLYSNGVELIHGNGAVSTPRADPGRVCSDNPASTLSIAVSGGDNCLAAGDQATLTVTGNFNQVLSQINWFNNSGGTSTSVNGPGTYWVTVTNELGCYDSLSIEIADCDAVCDECDFEPYFAVDQLDGCRYLLEGNFIGTSCPAQQFEYTIVNVSTGQSQTVTGQNQIHTFPGNGTYEVTMRMFVNNPDGSLRCERFSEQTIEVRECRGAGCEKPCDLDPFFDAYCPINCEECVLGFNGGNHGANCEEQQYRYEVFDSRGTLVHTYYGQHMIYDFPGEGSYKVCMTIWVGDERRPECEERYCETVEFSRCPKKGKGFGEELFLEEATLSVSPVPGNGKMRVLINSQKEQNATVRLMNLAGVTLFELKAAQLDAGNNALNWDLAGKLSNGTYLITVQLSDQVLSMPILIRQ